MVSAIDLLLKINKDRSHEFISERPRRRKYRQDHPTEIGVFECMDGRVHLPLLTRTPFGIIQSWRNMGGQFDLLHWPRFQTSVRGFSGYARRKKVPILLIVGDHFSRSSTHLGCRGHNYDFERSQASNRELERQFDYFFGDDPSVYTIRIAVETDEDTLVFYGKSEGILDLGMTFGISREDLIDKLKSLYPGMEKIGTMIEDLAEIGMRNERHAATVRMSKRPLAEADHREWVIGVGQGFDWLHEPNTALIIGPFDPKLSRVIKKAGGLIRDNIQRPGFNRERGVALISLAPFRPEEGSSGRKFASLQAMELARQAARALEEVPEIRPYLHSLTAIVSMEDCRLTILDGD